MTLKLVVTTLVCIKLVINLWQFATPEKRYFKKRLVYTPWAGIPVGNKQLNHMKLQNLRSNTTWTRNSEIELSDQQR